MSSASSPPRSCPRCSTTVRPVQFDLEDPEHCPNCGHVFTEE